MKADRDAYVSKSDVCLGRNTMLRKLNMSAYFQLGESIIVNLTSDSADKNHQIYLDTYVSSAPLSEYLNIKNVFACAAITNKKHLPDVLITVTSLEFWL